MANDKNEANKRLIEKINDLEKDYGQTFSNTQKILLTTDGSITAILDVLYGKITLDTLDQHLEKADEERVYIFMCIVNKRQDWCQPNDRGNIPFFHGFQHFYPPFRIAYVRFNNPAQPVIPGCQRNLDNAFCPFVDFLQEVNILQDPV